MMKRRTGLMLGLLTVLASSGVGFAGGASGVAPKTVWPEFSADSTCTPAIQNGTLRLGTRVDPKASAQVKVLYNADQMERKGAIDAGIIPRDLTRRKAALELLKSGKLSTASDVFSAAYIFQHGDCANHYLLAHTLAEMALKMGRLDAKFISAATYDRWLLSTGKPQKYGTQMPGLRTNSNTKGKLVSCEIIEMPINPATKDSDLKLYGLPTLEQREKNAEKFRQNYTKQCSGIEIKDIK